MPTPKNSLKDRLARYRQIKIAVIGRKSGQTISIPVWFVLEGENLYLSGITAGRGGSIAAPPAACCSVPCFVMRAFMVVVSFQGYARNRNQ